MNNPSQYGSIKLAISSIYTNEGIKGFSKGLWPSTLRGAFIAAGELATYDHAKTKIKYYFNIREGFFLHTLSSLITGVVATTVAAPFDIIKTR
jgi:hypothetical protein